ncbi:MAG: prepilin peptidase [Planctomycetota bacterium]|nr:prepilin peptidase [Planctomycetota bacterium]
MPSPAAYPAVAVFLTASAFVFGSVIGSFLNACIYRLPRGISVVKRTRSFCPKCEATIAASDNIPILSYLLLRGRCRSCREPIPARYFIVEVLTACLFALLVWQDQVLNTGRVSWGMTAARLFLAADLICLSFIDIEHYLIPRATTTPWIFLGIAMAPLLPDLHYTRHPWTGLPWADSLLDSIHGALLGGGMIWLVGFAGRIVFRKEAMGAGDVSLMAMIGAFLGWKPAMEVFLIAPFFGSVVGLAELAWRRYKARRTPAAGGPKRIEFKDREGRVEEVLEGNYMPYGPFLALAAVLVLVYEPLIRTGLAWYVAGAGGTFEFRVPLVPFEYIRGWR